MTTIDFNALMSEAGEGFQPIPDGPYHVEVAKSELVQTSTNKPMIKLQLRIIGGPHAGRLVFDQMVLSAGNANALSFFFEHMAAFGLDRSFFAQNPPMETVTATLMNRQALIVIGTRTDGQYAGRNEVKKYSAPPMGQVGGGMPTAPPLPPQVAPPAPVAPTAPVMPVAPPQAPQPAPAAPVAPPMPVAPPAPIPPLPPGVAAPQPVYAQPAPVAPAPAGVPVYNPADEEPYLTDATIDAPGWKSVGRRRPWF